jgi:threonine dehydrogenase-like Zn-dependent dehydrogenase
VLTGPRQFELTSRQLAECPPGTVRVAVEGCGVCGSNLPVWEGRPWFEYPLAPGAPGHEAWGWVEAVGDDVSGCAAGDRVAFLCDDAFADAVLVPSDDVVVLPAALSGQPFPGEALGCGFTIAGRSGFAAGQTVCVVGLGFLGAVVTALAAQAGARVVAVSRRPFSLEVARKMGAVETVELTEPWAVVDEVSRLTGGDLCDVVVEAVGAQAPLDIAGQLVQVRGRLVVAGFHQDGPRTVDMQLWNWRGIDVVNAHERESEVRLDGIRQAATAVAEGRLDPSPLYTHTYPLDQTGAAMTAMAERPPGFVKALVVR